MTASDQETATGTFEIVNELGMHARAAAKLVRIAESFSCSIEAEKDDQKADAKSIMGVLLLCGHPGSKITIVARGDGAANAVQAIGALIESRFGEPK